MKKRKFGLALSLVLAAGTILGACGSSDEDTSNNDTSGDATKEETTFRVGMVTDTGGIDDKSFNQSAWEGLQAFGEENGIKEGNDGYNYLQSKSDADYATNLNTMVRNEFDLVFGIGFLLADSIKEVAEQRPEAKLAIVDSVVEGDNIASITFKEEQGSFLVGVVAAHATKSNKIGFIGGVDSELINKFEVGFIAGVKSVNPDAEVLVQYANDFNKADIGKEIANSMYKQDIDVIYHAAGGTGNGVFVAAIEMNQADPEANVWVIGVDRDQALEEGLGEVTLTSMVKRVDLAVKDLSERTLAGNFPGGEVIEYGLEEGGVGIAPTQDHVPAEALTAVEEWTGKIKSGEITVPKTRDELKAMGF